MGAMTQDRAMPESPSPESIRRCALSVISVIKSPATGFEKTAESVMREFADDPEAEYIIKEHVHAEAPREARSQPLPGGFTFPGEPKCRIVHLRSADAGVFDGMNQALAAARGEWILFLNAGDWFSEGMGSDLRAVMQAAGEATFLYFDGVTVDCDDGRQFFRRAPDRIALTDFLRRVPILHPCLVLRRDYLRAIPSQAGTNPGFDLRYDLAADFDLMARLAETGVPGQRISRVGAFTITGGLSGQRIVRARRQALTILLRRSPGWRFSLRALRAFAFFLVFHAVNRGFVSRLPAMRRWARSRTGGQPPGTYR